MISKFLELVKSGEKDKYSEFLDNLKSMPVDQVRQFVNYQDVDGKTPLHYLVGILGDKGTAYRLMKQFNAVTGIADKHGNVVKSRKKGNEDQLGTHMPIAETIDGGMVDVGGTVDSLFDLAESGLKLPGQAADLATDGIVKGAQILDQGVDVAQDISDDAIESIVDGLKSGVQSGVGLFGGMKYREYREAMKKARDVLEEKIIKLMKLKKADIPDVKAYQILYTNVIHDEINKDIKEGERRKSRLDAFEEAAKKITKKDLESKVKSTDFKKEVTRIKKLIKDSEDAKKKLEEAKKKIEKMENFDLGATIGGMGYDEMEEMKGEVEKMMEKLSGSISL